MFPRSDDEFRQLLDVKGAHHVQTKPPPTSELDQHIFFLPADVQFSVHQKADARIYAVTANYSYFPVSVDLSFLQSNDVLHLLGDTLQSEKVPPVEKNGDPGVNARFVGLRSKTGPARTDVGAQWEISKSGKTVRSELLIAAETV